MDPVNLFDFYELGSKIHPLIDWYGDQRASDVFAPLHGARITLGRLLVGHPHSVHLCVESAKKLKAEVDDLCKDHFEDENGAFKFPDEGSVVPSYRLHTVRTAAQNFEAVFRAEMGALATYRVPKKPGQDTADMVDRAHELIPQEYWPIVGQKTLDEVQFAGRCMAFGLYSASGFHICRAVEAVTEQYYSMFSGKSESLASWNEYVSALEKIYKGDDKIKPTQRIIYALRNMKDLDRNPLMHPRVVLGATEADLLFSSARVCIILMAQEIQAGSKEPVLENLPGLSEGALAPPAGLRLLKGVDGAAD